MTSRSRIEGVDWARELPRFSSRMDDDQLVLCDSQNAELVRLPQTNTPEEIRMELIHTC